MKGADQSVIVLDKSRATHRANPPWRNMTYSRPLTDNTNRITHASTQVANPLGLTPKQWQVVDVGIERFAAPLPRNGRGEE
jgi:hypothetical protein